ncbi:MAG: SEL1-like repeat protein, partial [Proteobacteria bacterium]|nr:SEL1-like repeat protein [Pseudomonadota bacterium]
AAEQGYSGAQTNLGTLYYYGRGVERNRDKAIEWYRAAADQGDLVARDNLSKLGIK